MNSYKIPVDFSQVPGLFSRVEQLIEQGAEVVFDVASETGSMVDNVKHMRWFYNAIAKELIGDLEFSKTKWARVYRKWKKENP